MIRRDFLIASGGALALTGCDGLWSGVAGALGESVPDRVDVPSGSEISAERHLVERAAFGPWPGDEERVRRMGWDAWIEEQLDPARIDDSACDARTMRIDAMHASDEESFEMRAEAIEGQLTAFTLLRAIYSKRQLNEVMVELWTDHFNVAIGKSLCKELTIGYVRDVIRPRALGDFPSLLRAVTRSAAMLVYLDGRANERRANGAASNENHARELLELHALGVDAGYTQRDVMEAARCLTGFTVREPEKRWAKGSVELVPSRHDDGEKRVLGTIVPKGGGEADLDRLVDLLVKSDACAHFIAKKIARRFVSVDPPEEVVREAAKAFRETNGAIAPVVRSVLLSKAFLDARGAKLKRPFRFVTSTLRALAADVSPRSAVPAALAAMGHAPFQHPTPDGYSEKPSAWMHTLLGRFNFALALAEGRLEGVSVDRARIEHALGARAPKQAIPALTSHLLGRDPDPTEAAAFWAYGASDEARLDPRRRLALVLSTPRYQWH